MKSLRGQATDRPQGAFENFLDARALSKSCSVESLGWEMQARLTAVRQRSSFACAGRARLGNVGLSVCKKLALRRQGENFDALEVATRHVRRHQSLRVDLLRGVRGDRRPA